MTITKGMSLGPYEIISHLAAGGMGEVWRARDRRIGRDVAIKVLAESFSAGDERLWRFEQEARAAGALNHPGLVTIFDVGTTDGSPYIVMELLEGETLRDLIGEEHPSPLPLRKAIDYATQIASALAVAHEKGIIHRDLKPENLLVTIDNRVKILDFGLAKLGEATSDSDPKNVTARQHFTSAGIVVGTPNYMSPEQVRARPLDARTDIFSFGTVLYEMLTGQRVFERESAVETMHAVLNVDPPPMSAYVANIPPGLEEIVRHCLEKNPRERFQSARDLAFQLRLLADGGNVTAGRAAQTGRSLARFDARRVPKRGIIGAAILLAAAAGGFAIYRVRGAAAPPAPRAFRQLTFADGLEQFPTLAQDGKTFAYVSASSGNRDIYVQRVDGRTATNITADSPDDDSQPAFAPDGSQIVFRSERDGGGLFVMGVNGESVRRLTDFGFNPSWAPDGTRVVFSTAETDFNPNVHPETGALWIVDVRNGALRQVMSTGGVTDAMQPAWSPHGKRIAFWGVAHSARRDIWTIDPDAPRPIDTLVRVTSDPAIQWNPVWASDGGHLYFGSNADGTMNLWRVAIDEESGEARGAAEPLSLPAAISGNFAVSQQGEMAFSNLTRSYRLLAIPLDPATGATGEPRPLLGGTFEMLSFEPSPDGRTIAFTTGGSREDLFIANADGTRLRQLTNDPARDRGVTWSADGKTLYVYSDRGGSYHIWSIRADGSGLSRVTDDADLRRFRQHSIYVPSASPDGRTLAAQMEPTPALVHLDQPITHRIEPIRDGIAGPQFSPDGRRLAGMRPEQGGGIVVYTPATRTLEKVFDRGGYPAWLPDGRHIAVFEKRSIDIIDSVTHQVTAHPFVAPSGVDLSNSVAAPRLSRDGTMLYVVQTQQQGDIWMVHFQSSR